MTETFSAESGWERVPGDMPPGELYDALRRAARGWLPAEAAVDLLHEHGSWLKRKTLRRHIDYSPHDGGYARIRWSDVAAELAERSIPASSSEYQVLHAACGLTTAEAPPSPSLWDTISSLDVTNLHLVMQAMAHARGWHEHRTHPDAPPGVSRLVTGHLDGKEQGPDAYAS